MHLIAYGRQHLEGMCAAYNAQAAGEPHIAPLTPDLFRQFVEAKSHFDPAGLCLALDGGDVIGWIHACVAPSSEPWQQGDVGVPRIRMLVYPPDRPEVGVALVREGTAWLSQQASDGIEALHYSHGYPFYRGLWMGGEPMNPTSLPHLHTALECGGYKADVESVFMVGHLESPPETPAPSLTIEFEEAPTQMAHAGMRESWAGLMPMTIRAMHRGASIGEVGWVLLSQVAPKLGAPCANIWSLGVREEHRRKGVASALVSRVLSQAYHSGSRFGSVGTQLWNEPAHRTYARFSFRPHCLMIGRKLSPQPHPAG